MTAAAVPSRWFTVADGADPPTVAAIYRGALAAQRPRISDFRIDVLSDRAWPAEVRWAVDELDAMLEERRQRPRPLFLRWLPRASTPTVTLAMDDDRDFSLASAIAPFTIGGAGIRDGQIIWDGNDTGTSGAFRLTDDEADEVRRALERAGCDPAALVPLDGRGGTVS